MNDTLASADSTYPVVFYLHGGGRIDPEPGWFWQFLAHPLGFMAFVLVLYIIMAFILGFLISRFRKTPE
jgi:hypothetical protein